MSENVGFVGLGKLGLPVALAIESKGHSVVGYDINPDVEEYLQTRSIPYVEEGLQPLLDTTKLRVLSSVGSVVMKSDLIMIPIQTPHEPQYEGATRIPDTRKDFNYNYLVDGITSVAQEALLQKKRIGMVVISTCLPGTYEREIKPIIEGNPYVEYVYSPQFIAMGTVLRDYLNPEFNLIGVEHEAVADELESFYKTINDAPALKTDITTAEAIKVSYNTFITMKTVLGNTWGELCHKLGANVDDVFEAWSMSGKRLLSPQYLRAGVGDGGGCHPRDNIALSYLAESVGLSHNIFEDLMSAREDHMAWLAQESANLAAEHQLQLLILGRSFKPETNIETGSSAVLLSNILKEDHAIPHLHVEDIELANPHLVVIGTKHQRYREYRFPEGSVVVDPFRYIPDQEGVKVIRIGEGNGH